MFLDALRRSSRRRRRLDDPEPEPPDGDGAGSCAEKGGPIGGGLSSWAPWRTQGRGSRGEHRKREAESSAWGRGETASDSPPPSALLRRGEASSRGGWEDQSPPVPATASVRCPWLLGDGLVAAGEMNSHAAGTSNGGPGDAAAGGAARRNTRMPKCEISRRIYPVCSPYGRIDSSPVCFWLRQGTAR